MVKISKFDNLRIVYLTLDHVYPRLSYTNYYMRIKATCKLKKKTSQNKRDSFLFLL